MNTRHNLYIEREDLATGNSMPARVDRVVRSIEAAELTSDNFWLLVKGSAPPPLFVLPAFLLFWLLVLAVLKETPDMGEASMSAVILTGELTGERNCSAMASLGGILCNSKSSMSNSVLSKFLTLLKVL